MMYAVYFGVDDEPCLKDLAIITTNKAQAESVKNQLVYLNFNNAYILEKENDNV